MSLYYFPGGPPVAVSPTSGQDPSERWVMEKKKRKKKEQEKEKEKEEGKASP